ncbi:MAG: NAD(P)/FAD-dependent oxidoreductase [Verrucomicrobiota bacterium]
MNNDERIWDVIIVGGGCAGLSAAIYLGRAMRRVLLIDGGQSLALWEPDVQNYFGFPEGISGEELIKRGKFHAEKYGAKIITDEIGEASRSEKEFVLEGKTGSYRAKRVLLATGVLHIPPDIPHVKECLGHSMFFCKDCDGYRNRGKKIVIVGQNNEAVEYALGMLCYASCVLVATNGKPSTWDNEHSRWISEYEIPVFQSRIIAVDQQDGVLKTLTFEDGRCVEVDALFTTRGDIIHNKLGKALGAKLDPAGQIAVDHCMKTSVAGLYAAGCVTPSNCQMIIAAGDGATGGQAINRDLFEESLRNHALRCFRAEQVENEQTEPVETKPA